MRAENCVHFHTVAILIDTTLDMTAAARATAPTL